ncbi:MAG: LamG domain-containing protein [Phycisphaerales bacterium]
MTRTFGQHALVALLAGLITTHTYAQDNHVREILSDRVNQSDLSDKVNDKIREFIDDQDLENVDLFTNEWEEILVPSGVDPLSIANLDYIPVGQDVSGNLVVVLDFDRGILDDGFSIAKISNTGEVQWERINSDGERFLEAAIDLDGNVYALFQKELATSGPVDDRFNLNLRKYSDAGDVNWTVVIERGLLLGSVDVDDDQNVYVVTNKGLEVGDEKQFSDLQLLRFRPDGVPIWSTKLGGIDPILSIGTPEIEIDRLGDLYVSYGISRGRDGFEFIEDQAIEKLNPLGERLWTSLTPFRYLMNRSVSNLVIDIRCNSYIVIGVEGGWEANAFDTDGNRLYTRFIADSTITDSTAGEEPSIALDRESNLFKVAVNSISTRAVLSKINFEGTVVGSGFADPDNGDTIFISNGQKSLPLVLDRFGNPYVGMRFINNGSAVYKFDRTDLSTPPSWISEGITAISDVRYRSLFSDFGDNIYYGGLVVERNPTRLNGVIGKIGQPFTDVPKIVENAANLKVEDRSLWFDGVGSVSFETNFFQLTPDLTQVNFGFNTIFSIPLLGDFGGSANFGGNVSFGTGFRAYATGGTFDLAYPGSMDFAIPGDAKRVAGSPFPIVIQFDPDPSANLVSEAEPGAGAHMTGNAGISLSSSANLVAFSENLATVPIVNLGVGWSGDLPFLGVDLPTGQPGQWIDFGDDMNFVSGRAKRPQFSSSGMVDLNSGKITSTLEPEVFFSLRGNITNLVTTYALGIPTIFSISAPGTTTSAWAFGANVNIAQAFAEIELEANQSLVFEPEISIAVDFNHPVIVDGVPGVTTKDVTLTKEGSTWTGTLMVTVPKSNLPPENILSMTPRASIEGDFSNRTWIDIQPKVGWETLQAGLSGDAFGEQLFDIKTCLFCLDIPLADDIPLDLFDSGFMVNAPQDILDPIQLIINPDGKPRIGTLSRVDLKMFIYDQVDADPFELAAFLNQPAKKMLIYGDNLINKNMDGFVMCHNGRIQRMESTVLNSRTAVVEIPNEMRLLPGIARIWAVNSADQAISESADFPIILPRPNLGTVGPNLWAGDPRVDNIAMDAIDGLTTAGTPSYIARRDYWYVLADMWNSVKGTSDLAFFNEFPIYDFEADPPMPAVLIRRDELSTVPNRTHNWDFEGDYLDPIGNVDIVSENQPGTPPPFVTEGVPSFLGQAIELEGNRLWVDPENFTPLGTDDFSISYWAKRNSFDSGFDIILDANNSTAGRPQGFAVYFFGQSPGLSILDDGSDESILRANSTIDILDQDWHHYIVVVDRDQSDGVRWYVDGELVSTHDFTSRQGFIGIPPNSPFEFGAQQETGGSTLNGQLADFTIYNRKLDSDEILRISNPMTKEPMPRFTQPVENGILYSLMPVSEYNEPGLINISLQSPAPGGGLSNSIDLTVAAPRPVIQNISPTRVTPGTDAFTLTVSGPLSVPFFDGFEQERFGNFNKSSTVMWGDHALETKYISPGYLTAEVPADLAALAGIELVSVYTPSNGTGYFDDFRGQIVLSGGESNAIPIEVRYPTPVINRITPDTTSVAILDRCLDNPRSLKLSVNGQDFQPGATIWFDGIEQSTFTQEAQQSRMILLNGDQQAEFTNDVIYTFLEISDLSTVFEAPIVVVNPDGYASSPVYLNIVDQATYEAMFNTTLPEQQESCP